MIIGGISLNDILYTELESLGMCLASTWAVQNQPPIGWLKKVQYREQNFIIWNSYTHNCIIFHIVAIRI
jgi:hypothetical protein